MANRVKAAPGKATAGTPAAMLPSISVSDAIEPAGMSRTCPDVHFVEAAKFKGGLFSEPDEGLLIALDGVSTEGSVLLADLERGLILSAIIPGH